jgi:hypothetical protein
VPSNWLARMRIAPIDWSSGRSAITSTGVPPTTRASTRDEPPATEAPLLHAWNWLDDTAPTLMAEPPSVIWADSTLAVAASTPTSRRVSADGSETINGPTGAASAGCAVSLTHGELLALATVGSDVADGGLEYRAALARQLSAACAAAGAALSAPAKAATQSAATA